MNHARHAATRTHVLWLLDEADRLDLAATEWTGKPDAVASVTEMTSEWVNATIGPIQLRRTANDLRVLAARITRNHKQGDSK